MVWPFSKKKQSKSSHETIDKKKELFAEKREQLSKLRKGTQFFGVKIIHCNCDAAVKLMDSAYLLSEDIPPLPLRDCTNPDHCECEYLGIRTMREIPDRRLNSRRESLRMEDERRKSTGRRKADASSWDHHEKL